MVILFDRNIINIYNPTILDNIPAIVIKMKIPSFDQIILPNSNPKKYKIKQFSIIRIRYKGNMTNNNFFGKVK